MTRLCIAAFFTMFTATAAFAACPATSPSIEGRVTFAEGDKRVTAAWLEKTLAGHRVVFDEGTEVYAKDGSYVYETGARSFGAPSYKFYKNGLRCIAYPSPRYDLYVVNDGKLVLINGDGGRFVGRVMK